MERLTSYENGLEREMICRQEECATVEEYCPHLNEANCPCLQEVLNKLAEYEDLEEQGLLLRLPYPLETDEVFLADEDSRDVYCLDAREFSPFKMDSDSEIVYRIDNNDFKASDFGRILFLTEQEAQAALEKMK